MTPTNATYFMLGCLFTGMVFFFFCGVAWIGGKLIDGRRAERKGEE